MKKLNLLYKDRTSAQKNINFHLIFKLSKKGIYAEKPFYTKGCVISS